MLCRGGRGFCTIRKCCSILIALIRVCITNFLFSIHKKLEADALAYYNSKVAQNYNVEIKLKELEIELTRAERWDGRSVPNILPMTASGTVVDVK